MEADTIKQAEMKEKIKKVSQKNEKTTLNQIILQKPHQRDKLKFQQKTINSADVKNSQRSKIIVIEFQNFKNGFQRCFVSQ